MIINGIEYEKRPQPKRSYSRSHMTLAVMASMFGGFSSGYTRERPNVSIEDEFELIQQKKSKLSRNDREWIVDCFHKIYKPVKEATDEQP